MGVSEAKRNQGGFSASGSLRPVNWLEKEIKSVANVTRRDIEEFLTLAARIPIIPEVEEYPLDEANRALAELKEGKIRGAKVLRIS